MADYTYKEESTDKGMNPLTVAFLGAVAGAVGTGVAMALSNPRNRKKVQQTMRDSQQWIDKTMSSMKSSAGDMKESLDDAAGKMTKQADQKMDDAKEASSRARTSMK